MAKTTKTKTPDAVTPKPPALTADQWVILRTMRIVLRGIVEGRIGYSAEYARIWAYITKTISPTDLRAAAALLDLEAKARGEK